MEENKVILFDISFLEGSNNGAIFLISFVIDIVCSFIWSLINSFIHAAIIKTKLNDMQTRLKEEGKTWNLRKRNWARNIKLDTKIKGKIWRFGNEYFVWMFFSLISFYFTFFHYNKAIKKTPRLITVALICKLQLLSY